MIVPQEIEHEVGAQSGRATPVDSIVPQGGCPCTILSFAYQRVFSALQSFNHSCLGKIKSIFMFVTVPCYMFCGPIWSRRQSQRSKFGYSGIIYFYCLLSCTIVFNLWEQRIKPDSDNSLSYQFLQWFEISCMMVTIIFLLYITLSTRGRVIFENHEINLTLYFRAGLYVFGISSLLYAILNLVNNCNCDDVMHIVYNSVKAVYIAGQILFLNCFYQAKLPGDNRLIKIAFAHILGTNLSLWIWLLCKEVYQPPKSNKCEYYPIHLHDTERYFYPLFVEYLLLVASMIYEIWASLLVNEMTHDDNLYARYYAQIQAEENGEDLQLLAGQNRQAARGMRRGGFTPGPAISLLLGLTFAAVFIAFVLASNESGVLHQSQYHQFLIVNICLYCSHILACYTVLVCRQSQRTNEDRNGVDHDDALLYLGLAGILLWEGFHLYALIFSTARPIKLEYANGIIGIVEYIIQTITLVSIRRYRRRNRNDSNASIISYCALFLLATNFALWCENSFYVGQNLENPGENHKQLKNHLEVFSNILNPLIIFFRFHSATCSYHVWTIFNSNS